MTASRLIDTWPDAAKRAFQDHVVLLDRSGAGGLDRKVHILHAASGQSAPQISPLDAVSLTFAVRQGGDVAAAIRLLRARDAALDDDLACLLVAARLPSHDGVVLSCLSIVRADAPASELIAAACQQAYRSALAAGAQVWLLASPVPLAKSFVALGFRDVGAVKGGPVRHRVLRLDLFDVERLWRKKSPLLTIAQAFASEPVAGEAGDGPDFGDDDMAAAPPWRCVLPGVSFGRGLIQSRTAATILRAVSRSRARSRTARRPLSSRSGIVPVRTS